MSINEMINELKHYTNVDFRERPMKEVVEMYHELFKSFKEEQ